MARHDDGNRIRPARLSHRARRRRPFDRLRHIEVGASRAGRNRKKLIPDFPLEIRALEIERQRSVQFAAGDLFPNCIKGSPERRIVTLYLGLRKSRAQVR